MIVFHSGTTNCTIKEELAVVSASKMSRVSSGLTAGRHEGRSERPDQSSNLD